MQVIGHCMLTLFPHQNTPIIIQQGGVGDCYLLASIDCLLHSGDEGCNLLKSMFTETELGVYVRIKRSEQSHNLDLDRITAKYGYFYDTSTEEDVFFLDHERLEAIDKTKIGVRTNALAIKILEHLSSYYFEKPPVSSLALMSSPKEKRLRLNSVEAHDLKYRFTSTNKFVARLFHVPVHHSLNIEEILQIKAIQPDLPIYVSMDYGKYRHGLRVEHVIPTPPSSYQFTLVNPHNNTIVEKYTLHEMVKRKPVFSIFVTDPEKYKLLRFMLKQSVATGQEIFADQNLLTMILLARKIGGSLVTLKDMCYCVVLYRRNNNFPVWFNDLPSEEQSAIILSLLKVKDALQDRDEVALEFEKFLVNKIEQNLSNKVEELPPVKTFASVVRSKLTSAQSDSFDTREVKKLLGPAPKIRSFASVTKHGLFNEQGTVLTSSVNKREVAVTARFQSL